MLLEFLNTGLVMCLVSLIGLNKALVTYEDWRIRPEKRGYDGFDADWYFEVGRIVTLTCFLSAFASNGADLRGWCKAAARQRRDRGGSANLKRFPHDEDDDAPNTKLLIQEDLERLYEGPNFECETTLARMMSVTWTLVVFSSGMPVLYALGFVFYLLTYLTNKLLIMKYYKRTDSILSREIPLTAVRMMRYAVVLKMFVGLYMLNNPSIIRTRDAPTKAQIPFYVDVRAAANSAASRAGRPAPFAEGEVAEEGETTLLHYMQFLHQQLNIALVFGSLALFFLYKFGLRFGALAYDATVGAFLKLCVKVWFLIKFVATYLLELLKKLLRWIRRSATRIRAFLRRRARRAQALTLMKAGKEHQSLEEIDADENRLEKMELKK